MSGRENGSDVVGAAIWLLLLLFVAMAFAAWAKEASARIAALESRVAALEARK